MSLTDNSTRSLQVVSGASSTTFTSPNLFETRFPTSGYRTGKDEVALKSLTLYYSWSNISAAKNNNTFSYKWGGVTYPVVLAEGIWTYEQIQEYFEQVMRQNGHYLKDSDDAYVYYIKLALNSVLYCISLTVTPVPSVLPAGYTNPAAITLSGNTPQIVIPSGFSTLTGFAAGTYPAAPQTSVYQLNSGIPQISDVSSINLLCNLVDNSGFSLSPKIIANFVVPPGTEPGSLITVQPNNLDWVPVEASQTFPSVTLELVDQLRRPITLRDTAGFVATLSIRRRS